MSYVQLKLNQSLDVDPVCVEYVPNSLKASAQDKRGTDIRRRVLPDNKIPKSWHLFPRLDENIQESFKFLAQESMKKATNKLIIGCFHL